jgi:hypothetical protein
MTSTLPRPLTNNDTRQADPLYRLAKLVRLAQLHEQGRLPLAVMRAMDAIDLDLDLKTE